MIFPFKTRVYPTFPPSEVGMYGYQKKGLEITYTLVSVASPYVPYSRSYRVSKKFRIPFSRNFPHRPAPINVR